MVLPASEVPVAITAGQTFTAPWAGWYMQSGTAVECFNRCAEALAHQ